jgi:hypothetical protein
MIKLHFPYHSDDHAPQTVEKGRGKGEWLANSDIAEVEPWRMKRVMVPVKRKVMRPDLVLWL